MRMSGCYPGLILKDSALQLERACSIPTGSARAVAARGRLQREGSEPRVKEPRRLDVRWHIRRPIEIRNIPDINDVIQRWRRLGLENNVYTTDPLENATQCK